MLDPVKAAAVHAQVINRVIEHAGDRDCRGEARGNLAKALDSLLTRVNNLPMMLSDSGFPLTLAHLLYKAGESIEHFSNVHRLLLNALNNASGEPGSQDAELLYELISCSGKGSGEEKGYLLALGLLTSYLEHTGTYEFDKGSPRALLKAVSDTTSPLWGAVLLQSLEPYLTALKKLLNSVIKPFTERG